MQINLVNSGIESAKVKAKKNVRGFVIMSEEDRLLEDFKRPGLEKLQLFTKMLRRNAMFNNATRITKPE